MATEAREMSRCIKSIQPFPTNTLVDHKNILCTGKLDFV